MTIEDIGKALLAGAFVVWANRATILQVAAEAVALAERANDNDGAISNAQLEDIAVSAFRQVKPLRWLPEYFVRLAIRQICNRRRKATRKLATIAEERE